MKHSFLKLVFVAEMFFLCVGCSDEASEEKYRALAILGNSSAQYNLGMHYYQGIDVAIDHDKAVKWFRRSAEQSDEMGQLSMAFCYYLGHGVQQDYVKAYAWSNLAASQEQQEAIILRDKIGKNITPAQIKEGLQLSEKLNKNPTNSSTLR